MQRSLATALNMTRGLDPQRGIPLCIYWTDMKLLRVAVFLAIATANTAVIAAELPHADLVQKYLQSGRSPASVPRCERDPVLAPMEPGVKQECWAAHTAVRLAEAPAPIKKFALDTPGRVAMLKQCRAYSHKQLMETADCRTAAQAESLISVRLSSIRSRGLKPVSREEFQRAGLR